MIIQMDLAYQKKDLLMIVAHNLAAMNTNRMFQINENKKAKLAERLASGYKINRSADDAAGLAISEKCADRFEA